MSPWRRPLTRHDPGKVLLDLALSLAIGGDCLADIAQLRAHPQVLGPVASDPTVSRLIDTLAADAPAALAAINAARAAHQQLDGSIVLVWDNLSTHTSGAMTELIAGRPWLTVYRLPPYAHELNPVE